VSKVDEAMEILRALGLPRAQQNERSALTLPDVVLFDTRRNWVYLVEAVTSHGPVSPKRHAEIERMMATCTAEPIYVTAFLTKGDFRRFAADIAWETEVWIAETPDHMIHFNGPQFLGPYRRQDR